MNTVKWHENVRKSIFQTVDSLYLIVNLGFATLSLQCLIDIAKTRNAQRPDVIPATTLDAIASQIEQPDPSKYPSNEEKLNWCDAVW